VNEKGEILGMVDGKEHKCGKIRLASKEEIKEIERKREREKERKRERERERAKSKK
jgi:hypothetical protein